MQIDGKTVSILVVVDWSVRLDLDVADADERYSLGSYLFQSLL